MGWIRGAEQPLSARTMQAAGITHCLKLTLLIFDGTELPSVVKSDVDIVPVPDRERQRAAYRNKAGVFPLYGRHRIPIPKEAQSTPDGSAVPSTIFIFLTGMRDAP